MGLFVLEGKRPLKVSWEKLIAPFSKGADKRTGKTFLKEHAVIGQEEITLN